MNRKPIRHLRWWIAGLLAQVLIGKFGVTRLLEQEN
jgi:hypothetical protein